MATAIMTATAPPPTRNALEPAQRVRLIRSTRKLGAILGATPHLIEAYEPASSNTRSDSPVSFASLSSTDLSAPSRGLLDESSDKPCSPKKSSKKHGSPAQTLFLKLDLKSPKHARLESVDHGIVVSGSPVKKLTSPIRKISSSNDLKKMTRAGSVDSSNVRRKTRLRRSSSANAYWDLTSNPAHPNSATVTRSASTSITTEESRVRRKRMAKLQRTLGENVPVELVFRPSPLSVTSSGPRSPALSSDPFCDPQDGRSSRGVSIDCNSIEIKSSVSQSIDISPTTPLLSPSISQSSPHPRSRSNSALSASTTVNGRQRPMSLSSASSLQMRPLPEAPLSGDSVKSGFSMGQSFLSLSPASPTVPSPRFSSPPGILSRPRGGSTHTHAVSLDMGTKARPFAPTDAYCLVEAPAFGRRREKEWSGEWNKEDMVDVVKQLRGLKSR